MTDWRTKSGIGFNPIRALNYTISIIVALLVAGAIYRAIPPSHITIETGPIGGSYYDDALEYKQVLQNHGIAVTLRPNPDSLKIIGDVEAATNGLRIGFLEHEVTPGAFPDVRSLGAVELQPLFIFYSARLGEIENPAGLRGRRLVMPPKQSATSDAALRLLRYYGVTPNNTGIAFLPIAEAIKALHEGRFDAGFFVLAARNKFIAGLATDPNLRLLPMRDAVGLSRLDPVVRPVVLPHGVYNVQKNIPPNDVPLLAETVNVIARKNIPPAILYPLLGVMADVHRGPSLINNAGTFPNLVDISLPAHPLAKQYEKSGTPWIYRNLPAWLASIIDSYFVIGLTLIVIAEAYKLFYYFMELVDFLFENLCLRVLVRIERRHHKGHELGAIDMKLVDIAESALFRTSRRRRSEELIGRIRQAKH